MPTHILKYVKTYATYSELHGHPFDREELKKIIRTLPWGAVLNVTAQMLARPVGSSYIKTAFSSSLRSLGIEEEAISHLERQYEDRALVYPQGLLSVCKWLLAYGDPAYFDRPADVQWATGIAVFLCTIVSDYLYVHEPDPAQSSENLVYEMVRNAVFNASEDPYMALARTNYIYMTLGADQSLYEPKEYVDYVSHFHAKYGYSIHDYLSVLFGMITTYIQMPSNIEIGWVKDLDQWFSETGMATLAGKIAREQMAVSLEEAREWALGTIDAPWDFSLFQARPLLTTNDQMFFPLFPKFLDNQIFHGLFHKIRHCYPETDTNFMRFFGRPFEEYVKLLVREAVAASTLPYQVLNEFTYVTARGEERSPDVMIRLGNRLLAVEVKSMRMRIGGLVGGNRKTVDEDLDRMVAEPLKRAHDKLVDLLQPRCEVDLSGVNEIYLMTVSMGEFPTLQPLEVRLLKELGTHYSLPVKGSYHLDIEEFEYFCTLLSGKRPVFRVLDNKTTREPYLSFRTFLYSSSLARKRPEFVDEKALEFTSQIQKQLFPDAVEKAY